MRKLATRIYPWAVPCLVGAAFVAASAVAQAAPATAGYVISGLGAFAAVVSALAAYGLARIGHNRRVSALTAASPLMLVAGAFGCFVIVDTDSARLALAAAAVILTAVYLAYVRGMVGRDERFRTEDFSHLSFALHVTSVFFILSFAFALPEYLQVSLPVAALMVAVVMLVTTGECARRAGLAGRDANLLCAAFVALGVQLYVALSFLPTTDLVNAAVCTVLYAAGLHAAVASLSGKSQAPALRRQFAMSFALVVLVFATARWA